MISLSLVNRSISDFIKVNHDARLNRLPLTVSCWFNANQQISPAGALVGKYYAASWTGWQLTLNELIDSLAII